MIYLSKSDMGPFKEPWGKKPLNLENIELAKEGFSHIASDILIYCKHVQIETLLVLVPQQIPNIVPRSQFCRVPSVGRDLAWEVYNWNPRFFLLQNQKKK